MGNAGRVRLGMSQTGHLRHFAVSGTSPVGINGQLC